MGYQSEVAYIIEPVHITPAEFMQDFREAHPAEYQHITEGYLKDFFRLTPSQIRFENGEVKWYTSGDSGFSDPNPDYAEVDAHMALLAWSDERNEDAYYANDGAFVRIGQDNDDVVTRYWGEDPYELVSVQRFISIAEVR